MTDSLSNLCRQYFKTVFPAHTEVYDHCVERSQSGETPNRSDILPYLGFELKDGDLPDDIITLILALIRVRQSNTTDLDDLLEIVEETCKELDGSTQLVADLSDFLREKLSEGQSPRNYLFSKLFQPKAKDLSIDITYSETKLNKVVLTHSNHIGFVILMSFYLQGKPTPIHWLFAQGKKSRNELQKNFISRLNRGKLKRLPCEIAEVRSQYLYRGKHKTTDYTLKIEDGISVTGNPIDSRGFLLKSEGKHGKKALDLLDKAVGGYPLWIAPFKKLMNVLQDTEPTEEQKKRLLKNVEQFSGFIEVIQKNYDLSRGEDDEVIRSMVQPELDSWRAVLGQIKKLLSGSVVYVDRKNQNPLMVLFHEIKVSQQFKTDVKPESELLSEEERVWIDEIAEALAGKLNRAFGYYEVDNPKIIFVMSHLVVLETLDLPNTLQPNWKQRTADFFFELNKPEGSSVDAEATDPADLDWRRSDDEKDDNTIS